MLARVRVQLVRRRTRLSNAIRGYAAEFGLGSAKRLDKIEGLLVALQGDETLPLLARGLFVSLAEDYARLATQLKAIDAEPMIWHRGHEVSRRLTQIPSIGPIGATLLVLKTPDLHPFANGRQFAAWIGLTPRDHSTAGRTRQGAIKCAGDATFRSVLVVGAMAVIRQAQRGRGSLSPRLLALLQRKEPKEAAVALANNMARTAWKLMVSGETYNPRSAVPTDRAA